MSIRLPKLPALRQLTTAFALIGGIGLAQAATTLTLKTDVAGSGLQLSKSTQTLSAPPTESQAVAKGKNLLSADLNIDGFADLVSAYAAETGGVLVLHEANPNAHLTSSNSVASFKPSAISIKIPVAPDFIVAGDFNADGDVDLVVAERGDLAFYFLQGARTGFSDAKKFPLSAGVTALDAGEIDLPNAERDLLVAVSGSGSHALLVYRDGLTGNAIRYSANAPITTLALGQLDDDLLGDVAFLASGKISVLHGYNQRESDGNRNRIEVLDLPQAQTFALADFIWDQDGKQEIALLQSDGSIAFSTRGALNTNAFTLAEVRARRKAQHALKTVDVGAWQRTQTAAWTVAETQAGMLDKSDVTGSIRLIGTHLGTNASDDLMVLNGASNEVSLLSMVGNQRKRFDISSSAAPISAVSMRTSGFVLPSLVVLGGGSSGASILPSAPLATFSVSKTADTNDGTCNADCSLREAISAANATAGADVINIPVGIYTLTIANAAGLNEDNNAQGDLDINDALTITGAGSASTTIRAGTTTSNGIDKVFAFNPFCLSPMATSISGVTVAFGRNTQPTSAADFSYTGGGMDWCGTGSSSMAITNSVFDSNTNTLGYGGGINLDSFAANGSVTITGSTISNNRVNAAAGVNTGGGVNLFADQHSVTFTNSTINNNQTTGEGGGLFVRHTNGGAVLVQGTAIASNTAGSRGGGVSNNNFGASTLTINNDGLIQGNTSQGTAGGTESRGGGVHITAQTTTSTTINEVSITGNVANTGTLQAGGGIATTGTGPVSITFSRIAGNTAGTGLGSGLHNNGATTTANSNWWGCNAGPTAAPCDRSNIVTGTATLTPRLQLAHAAVPSTIVVGQTSALTASFLNDSAGGAVAVANLDAIIGTTHAHNAPVLGAHSATQAAIQAAGTATAIFTGTGVGAGSSSSVVDSQTQTVAITVGKANTTTVITSDSPDPSITGGIVAVNYSVSAVAPGAGTATGNVVVTVSGGAETCTGTVAAGTCNITLIGVGSRTLTASYVGDANFNASSDTETHVVNNPNSASINDVTVNEGNAGTTSYTFTVSLSAPAGPGGVTFDIATANSTATAGVDYVANSLTGQTIPASSSTYSFTVLVNGDTQNEQSETFFVNLSNITNAVVLDGQGVGTIVNDDALPSLSINDVSVTEGNSGTTNAVFTVTLNAASGQSVQVNYATADGTASQPADYTNTSGTLTFTPGQTTRTITVPVVGDVVSESNETYFVNLSGALNSTISDNQGIGTIVDDELPLLSINDVSISEGNSGTSILNFTVTRTGTTASAVGFNFATADGTATLADNDYVAASGTGTIPSGSASASTTVSVTINGDAVFENFEGVFVNLTAPTNAAISDAQGAGVINNDDTAPTLSINDVSITEGNSGSQNLAFTVTRTGLTSLPVVFTATTANDTATAPSDYLVALSGLQSVQSSGATNSTTLTATINGDALVEANETFFVNLSAALGGTISDNQGTGTITNDDAAGVVLVQSGGTTDVTEGGASDTYSLVLTSQPTSNVSIALNTGAQVTVATSPVVFTTANWNTLQTVTVTAVDDVIVEGNHTGTISHTVTSLDTTYNGFAVANVVANITDNDLPTLTINDVSIVEGNGGTSTLNFTVTRTGATPSAVGFNFATADSTATTTDNDYVAASGTGTIPSGGATATTTVSVTINGDATFENNESFFINLTAPTNAAISDAQGLGAITNDDTAPTLAINDVSVIEGNSGTPNLVFTITRTGLTALPATFTAATADGMATAPSDYLAALAGSTSIAAGGATGTTTLTATINSDVVVEANESFTVNLSAPANATIATGTGTGTITNDDTAGVVLVQSSGSTDVTEGGATDSYTLVLTSQPTNNVSIALNPGTQVTTATSPVVFTAANWDIAQTVTVTAVDDASIEGAHSGTISHTVTSSDINYNGFSVANVTANITDNDSPGASIMQSGGTTTAIEAGATDSYTIVLTSQPSSNVTITPSGTQVSAAPASLIFTNANWNVAQTVTVTALDDNVVEGAHTGSITHAVVSADTNYSGLSIGGVAGISITDNDSATVQFAPALVSQSEATSPMAFTVTLSNPVASGVTLSVSSAIGTATALDFTAITSGTVTFPANSTTAQTVNVVINNDALDEADENFSLTLSNVVATGTVTIATATATGTILDDDALPALSIANVSVAEGNAGTSPLNFVVTLTPVSGRDVSFSRATADGTATLANNDYVALTAGSITIPAGQTSVMIPVLINGDTVFEGLENFSLNLSAVSNATPISLTGTGTIAEDDQQPTTTTIVSDLPDPSVTGQSYAVTVNVAAQSTSPLGTVNVSDGAATCVITLAAATSPNSSGACNLTSTTAGAKTLTATYVPDGTAFGASTVTTTHQVNAASTTLTLSGPASIALNQPASYSFTLAVTAPGAGSPAGIVTVQSGAQSCNVTLPTATPNCAISFNSVGSKAISASFAPSNSDFSASNTSANINTLVFASSDLSVTKTDGVSSYGPNDLLVYTITVRNAGVDAAPQVRLVDAVPASLDNVAWTCVGSGGAICPAAGGVGSISQLYPSLPANSQLVYTLSGGVNGSPVSIVNTATVQLPSDGTVVATTPANLSATDTNLLDFIFHNGFEDATINATNGSFTFPSASLRGALDSTAVAIFSLQDQSGEVLRVYARVLDGELQYALATRSKLKVWRLSNWQTPNSEPTLSWRATRTADGFVFESAELR